MVTTYITAPPDAATELAEQLVAEQLAACVNLVDCASIYRWEDEVLTDDEVILLAKTTDERFEELADRVVDIHPYDIPCVERFADDPIPIFESWRDENVL